MARVLAAASLSLLQSSIDFPGVPPIGVAGFHINGALVGLHRERQLRAETTKKQVKVYIESGCPDSQDFVLVTLAQALDPAQGLTPLINVSLTAWGNAYHNGVVGCKHITSEQYNREGSHCWQSACKNGTISSHCFNQSAGNTVHQHGTKEGTVDRLVNCAMRHASSPWPYVSCVLYQYDRTNTSDEIEATCKENATDAEKATITTAETCAQSDEGRTLLMQAAESTPKHPGVPYVTIDDEEVDPDKFFQELCSRLDKTQVPTACTTLSLMSSASNASKAHRTSAKVAKAASSDDSSRKEALESPASERKHAGKRQRLGHGHHLQSDAPH
jgi:hypothetical protein